MLVRFPRNYEDAYTDPGSPMSRKTHWNTYVLAQLDDQQKLLLEGLPSSPDALDSSRVNLGHAKITPISAPTDQLPPGR